MDFFSDLMSVLHSLAESGVCMYVLFFLNYLSETIIMDVFIVLSFSRLCICLQGLSNMECMQCVSTAFEILSGQGV